MWHSFAQCSDFILWARVKPGKPLGKLNTSVFFTPGLMALSTAVSKSTTLPSTWNPLVAPVFYLTICLPPPQPPSLPVLAHPLPPPPPLFPQTSSHALKGHFVDILEGGVEVCLQVLRLHTSLSFGITTEKQHSHLHEKSGVSKRRRSGGWGVVGCGARSEERSEPHAGKGEPEKTDNNSGVCRRKQPSSLLIL